MFIWLESTAIARWVGESYYAYPGLLSAHIVGLAIVVGLFSMRDLKLLGLFPGLDIGGFMMLSKLAAAGFAVNVISGLLLFSSQASYLITSVPFLIKIAFIIAGMAVAVAIHGRLKSSPDMIAKSTRYLGLLSLSIWGCAIVAGRLIAYV